MIRRYFINENLYRVVFTDTSDNYWISSRYTEGSGTEAANWEFGMSVMLGQQLAKGILYKGDGAEAEVTSCGLRPVIIIPKTSCNIRPGGTNGETYHIEPKG